MFNGLLFLKPCPISRDGTPDFDVREGKPSGRTIGRVRPGPPHSSFLGWLTVLLNRIRQSRFEGDQS
jgi:hypothetical protein